MTGKHKEPKDFSGDSAQFLKFIKTARQSKGAQTGSASNKTVGKTGKHAPAKGK